MSKEKCKCPSCASKNPLRQEAGSKVLEICQWLEKRPMTEKRYIMGKMAAQLIGLMVSDVPEVEVGKGIDAVISDAKKEIKYMRRFLEFVKEAAPGFEKKEKSESESKNQSVQ